MFNLHQARATAHTDDLRREAERAGRRAAARSARPQHDWAPLPAITIRLARPRDTEALGRLANLDSRDLLPDPVLVADVDGGLRAALSLCDGSTLADPFSRSAGVLELLVIRARQLGGLPRRQRWRDRLRRAAVPPFGSASQ